MLALARHAGGAVFKHVAIERQHKALVRADELLPQLHGLTQVADGVPRLTSGNVPDTIMLKPIRGIIAQRQIVALMRCPAE